MSPFHKMLRILFFQIKRDELATLNRKDLALGIFITWIVGMGRYWDAPKARLIQTLGLGSVAYIVVLSAFLWLLYKPFKIRQFRFEGLLTFISLTSFPAILYALPVERWFPLDTAAGINAGFLAAVAAWRVALLILYLKRFGEFPLFQAVWLALVPLTFIVTALTLLNLELAVFNIMGGIRERTANDTSYAILAFLTFISAFLVIPLFIGYGLMMFFRRREKRDTPSLSLPPT